MELTLLRAQKGIGIPGHVPVKPHSPNGRDHGPRINVRWRGAASRFPLDPGGRGGDILFIRLGVMPNSLSLAGG